MSKVDGKLSWGVTTPGEHQDGFGKIANNYPAESDFGSTTMQLQWYDRVSLGNVGGVSQVQANGDMGRNIGGKQGLFHMLSTEMRNSLLLVSREDRKTIHKFDAYALENQRDEKQRKEELLK